MYNFNVMYIEISNDLIKDRELEEKLYWLTIERSYDEERRQISVCLVVLSLFHIPDKSLLGVYSRTHPVRMNGKRAATG